MSPSEVLVCVLALLGGEAKKLPPIELVDIRPLSASPGIEAYTHAGSPKIYLLTTSAVFEEAMAMERWGAEDAAPVIKLASIIMHEAWHVRNGPDERGAYEAQLRTLGRLGAGAGSALHRRVYNSMQTVLKTQKRATPADTDLRITVMLPVPPRPSSASILLGIRP
ncbi:MAG TPA: hypothetical protein VH702_17755 [Vicinamibacterales bacterium]|jgi:hypothetical protein